MADKNNIEMSEGYLKKSKACLGESEVCSSESERPVACLMKAEMCSGNYEIYSNNSEMCSGNSEMCSNKYNLCLKKDESYSDRSDMCLKKGDACSDRSESCVDKSESCVEDGQGHPVVLTIAGSDPCCGAGLQADIRVASALGCYATSVVTALTAQNTRGVYNVMPVSPSQVAEQGRVLIEDVAPVAIKVGMLGSEEVAREVLNIINASGCGQVVVDTILHSTSGRPLFEWNGGGAFEQILRRARVITPNLPEARVLLAPDLDCDLFQMPQVLSRKFGGVSVYLKGGHQEGDVLTDIFYNAETMELVEMPARRVVTNNTHGTGCCLSTSLACGLAMGKSLDESARFAHDFTHGALERGRTFVLGSGHGPTFSF